MILRPVCSPRPSSTSPVLLSCCSIASPHNFLPDSGLVGGNGRRRDMIWKLIFRIKCVTYCWRQLKTLQLLHRADILIQTGNVTPGLWQLPVLGSEVMDTRLPLRPYDKPGFSSDLIELGDFRLESRWQHVMTETNPCEARALEISVGVGWRTVSLVFGWYI